MKSPAHTISGISKVMLLLAAVCLASNIFLPIWKIDLYAPQYPEGLALLIYANRLGGDVEIINGLNHYIGMATLHTENFIEFSILPYILAFFSAAILVAALAGRLKGVILLFSAFALFSLVAMVDFYRWNYNYGHNLDPSAPIQVPGMAYQPPLIGFKQLLNFGAYSFPDTGGLLFILAGLLMLFVILAEKKVFARWRKPTSAKAALAMILIAVTACSTPGPKPIRLHTDVCAYCKMNISDLRFSTQLITSKGRHYFFDDITCMAAYKKENTDVPYAQFYVADFCSPGGFVEAGQAILLHSHNLRSPMAGNIAGFASHDSAQVYRAKFDARSITWASMLE